MASSEKVIAVPEWAPDQAPDLRECPSHPSQAASLDGSADEFELALAALGDQASAPARSATSSSLEASSPAGEAELPLWAMEPDGGWSPVGGDDALSRSDRESQPQALGEESPSGGPPTEPELQADIDLSSGDHTQDHHDIRSDSTEPDHRVEAAEPSQDLPLNPQAGAGRTRRWASLSMRKGASAAAIVVALGGIGAASLWFMAPGGEPAAVATQQVPATDADEQQWSAIAEKIELERNTRPVQEPIVPKRVKTVRIFEPLDEPAAALGPSEAPAVGQLDDVTQVGIEAAATPGAAALASNGSQVRSGPDGLGWTGSAVENASVSERLQARAGDPAPEEALIETKSGAEGPNRWPKGIPSEEDARSNDGTAASTEVSDLPNGAAEPAISAPADAAAPAKSDEDVGAAADPSSQSAEPTRFAPVTTHVNMRAEPASGAAVISVVPAGGRVGVVGCDSWCEVVYEGKRGWIYQSFVTAGG